MKRQPIPQQTLTDKLAALLCCDQLWPSGTSGSWMAGMFREHQFHDRRKWRFDLAWPAELVAVELEGATATWRAPKGRHVRPRGFQNDCEKYNAATERGWSILRYTSHDLDARPADVVQQIAATLLLRRSWQEGSAPQRAVPNPQFTTTAPPPKRKTRSIRG